jgi:hypothetical protein
MAKTWVLRTDTKGTGAQMVPLESTKQRSTTAEPVLVPRERVAEPESEVRSARAPHRFRVVDLLTRETLADDVSTREAVHALKNVRSVVDVNVYVWAESRGRWRPLTLGERKSLWELAQAEVP